MRVSNDIRDKQKVFEEEETVFVDQSEKSPVVVKGLRACRSYLDTVEVRKDVRLTKCTITKDLIVGGNLKADSCDLRTVKVKGKANLHNCKIDSIVANDDIVLTNDKIRRIFARSIETQKSVRIKNMDIGELTFRSGHTIIDNCNISTIRIKKTVEEDCILELRGNYQVGTIISEGVDVEIKARKLEP